MGKNVVIGCKLPHGLQLKVGNRTAVINGSNSSIVHGGYGMTSLDEEFFDAWAKEHKDYEPLKRDLIFKTNAMPDAIKRAEEQAEVRSGFEGVDPNAPGTKLEKVPDEEED